MTTIVYDGRGETPLLVADSLCTGGIPLKVQKLHRTRSAIIGVCGDFESGLVFVDWYKDKSNRKPDLSNEDDWEAIVVTRKGAEWWGPSLRPIPIDGPFYAIGSGSEFAVGALKAGVTADKAVRIAAECDINTGGTIVTMRLKGDA